MLLVSSAVETAPWWVVIVGSAGSGIIVWALGAFSNRRLNKLTAEKAAIEIVETALNVARTRIAALEQQVGSLTSRIEEMRTLHAGSDDARIHLQSQLDLALAQRAELQYQLIELMKVINERRIDRLWSARPADAIIIVDMGPHGTISYANDGVFGLLGYAPSELVGQALGILVPEEMRAEHAGLRAHYDHNPQPRQMGTGIPLYARRRDGSHIPVDISLHPTGDGRVIALVRRRADQNALAPRPVPITSTELSPVAS